MADEHDSVVGAVEHAEAIQADAMAAAANTAAVATQQAVANATETAAQLAVVASEHAAELEQKTAEHLAETEDKFQWLREATAAQERKAEDLSSALIQVVERQQKTEALLTALAEKLLTQPASETEAQTMEPGSLPSAEEAGQKEAAKQPQGRQRHRSI